MYVHFKLDNKTLYKQEQTRCQAFDKLGKRDTTDRNTIRKQTIRQTDLEAKRQTDRYLTFRKMDRKTSKVQNVPNQRQNKFSHLVEIINLKKKTVPVVFTTNFCTFSDSAVVLMNH